jgi:hypothetical protein
MPPTVTITILAALVLLLAVGAFWSKRYGGYMPEPYRNRPCQGVAWKRKFPEASKDEIRIFLREFTEGFAFRESQKLQVGPEDEILAVYRTLYPKLGGMDALEMETFANYIQRRYQIKFADIWSEKLTFGQLFSYCQSTSRARSKSEA